MTKHYLTFLLSVTTANSFQIWNALKICTLQTDRQKTFTSTHWQPFQVFPMLTCPHFLYPLLLIATQPHDVALQPHTLYAPPHAAPIHTEISNYQKHKLNDNTPHFRAAAQI